MTTPPIVTVVVDNNDKFIRLEDNQGNGLKHHLKRLGVKETSAIMMVYPDHAVKDMIRWLAGHPEIKARAMSYTDFNKEKKEAQENTSVIYYATATARASDGDVRNAKALQPDIVLLELPEIEIKMSTIPDNYRFFKGSVAPDHLLVEPLSIYPIGYPKAGEITREILKLVNA